MEQVLEKNDHWVLLEGIIEIRFLSELPTDAIFGLLYSEMKERFPNLVNLPILQVPEAVRTLDPNLRYSPYYQFSNENFVLELGPRVVILKNQPAASGDEYKKWPAYQEQMSCILSAFEEKNIISQIERVGVRYFNFFENLNIFEHIKPKVNSAKINLKNTYLGIETESDEIASRIKIITGADMNIKDEIKSGSVIDIDSYSVNPEVGLNFSLIKSLIDLSHDKTKDLLLDKILTKKYIDSTNIA